MTAPLRDTRITPHPKRDLVMGDMLNAKEVAEILGCSPDDVLNLRQKKVLRGYRYKSRLWRFRRADVEKLAAQRRGSASPEEQGAWKATVTATACMHQGPSETRPYLGLLEKGATVYVVDEKDGWCHFSREPGLKAWVKKSTLSRKGWLG